MNHHRPFLTLWVLAVGACVLAFVLHLAMRGRTMALAYELGKARNEQARLREVKRVLELEVASYQTPQRVEAVARSVLGMQPPSADRIIAMNATPTATAVAVDAPAPLPRGTSAARTGGGAAPAPRGGTGAPAGSAAAAPMPASTELLLPRVTPPKTAQPAASSASTEDAP